MTDSRGLLPEEEACAPWRSQDEMDAALTARAEEGLRSAVWRKPVDAPLVFTEPGAWIVMAVYKGIRIACACGENGPIGWIGHPCKDEWIDHACGTGARADDQKTAAYFAELLRYRPLWMKALGVWYDEAAGVYKLR